MANTTNLNLVKPSGTDYALVSVINGNMDIIDSKVGAIPANESAQSQITALNNQIEDLKKTVELSSTKTDVTNGATITLSQSANKFDYLVIRLSANSSDTSSSRGILIVPMVNANISAYYPIYAGGDSGAIRLSITGTTLTVHSMVGYNALYVINVNGCIAVA